MDQPFRLDFSQGLFSIQLPGMVLWSIIILIVAFAFRRRSLSDRGKWDKAWTDSTEPPKAQRRW
ncbi:MAG: hypothetical protein R2873_28865 [Caldilineaceae bacterium]